MKKIDITGWDNLSLSAERQGFCAEIELTEKLSVFRDLEVLRDVLIPSAKGSCQIDFIIITNRCIFVLEMKSFHGLIVGSGTNRKWTHFVNGAKYEYYNPILQNKTHINNLSRFLSKMPYRLFFYSIVYMRGIQDGKLDILLPYPQNSSIVTDFWQLRRVIQHVCERKIMTISDDDRNLIFNYIGSNQIRGDQARKAHAEYASEVQQMEKQALEKGICPRCKSKLIVRIGRYGRFLGCSRFPACKFTHKI